jgi:hypothetical protein
MCRLTVATHYVVTVGCFRAARVSSLTPSPRTACSHSVSRCHVAARDVATKWMTSHEGQKTTTGDEGRGLTLQPLPRPPTIDESGEKTANGDICRRSLSSFTLPPPLFLSGAGRGPTLQCQIQRPPTSTEVVSIRRTVTYVAVHHLFR